MDADNADLEKIMNFQNRYILANVDCYSWGKQRGIKSLLNFLVTYEMGDASCILYVYSMWNDENTNMRKNTELFSSQMYKSNSTLQKQCTKLIPTVSYTFIMMAMRCTTVNVCY